jgi:hypothetical protein
VSTQDLTAVVMTVAGGLGLALQAAWYWFLDRQGRGDEPVGNLGCSWFLACAILIVLGAVYGIRGTQLP